MKVNIYRIEYDSNNSGGDWWLSDEDWYNLEAAGWVVHWRKNLFLEGVDGNKICDADENGRWLGALATSAHLDVEAKDEQQARDYAVNNFEEITGEDTEEEGCECCGRPHCFYSVLLKPLEIITHRVNKITRR